MLNNDTAVVPVLQRPALKTMSAAREMFAMSTDQITTRLPQHLKPSAANMIAMALTAIQRTPKLLDCTPLSVLQTMITCSELGLNLNPAFGEAYPVPYKNICTPIIGYRGLMKLCEQSTGVRISAAVVYEHDEFDYALGTDQFLRHKPSLEAEPGAKRCAYAVGRYADGSTKLYIVTAREIALVRDAALKKSGQRDTPWRGDSEDAMWMKTAVRRLCKFLSMSPEVMQAIQNDEESERLHVIAEPAPATNGAAGLDALADALEVNPAEPDHAEPETVAVE